jgi:putative flippase GtrA
VHLARRWAIFNAVGAMGVTVQLVALALLVHGFGLNYLSSTAIAVEASILHNFAWHHRWTWRDRPVATPRGVMARLARFHLANGAVSLAGNLLVTGALAGLLGLDPVLANAAAIATCSLVNFAAGTALVFRTSDAS